jgi:menaquinone-9 beta-reductase
MRNIETVIVGGGPAGAACAWELTRRGMECLVLERRDPPRAKLCAGSVHARTFEELDLKASDYPFGLVEMRRMKVYLGLTRLHFSMPTLQYSIRRGEFDEWLLSRSGAEVVRAPVREISRVDGHYVIDGAFRCKFLVGAAGTHCPVKRAFFSSDRGTLMLTQGVEYPSRREDDDCVLFYPIGGWGGFGWRVPKQGAVAVGFAGPAAQMEGRLSSLWDPFARNLLERDLVDDLPPEPAGYAYYVGDRKKVVRKANAYIVGDAAGLATCDVGEGIGPAVSSGLAAAREISGAGFYSPALIDELTLPGPAGALMARMVAGARR